MLYSGDNLTVRAFVFEIVGKLGIGILHMRARACNYSDLLVLLLLPLCMARMRLVVWTLTKLCGVHLGRPYSFFTFFCSAGNFGFVYLLRCGLGT